MKKSNYFKVTFQEFGCILLKKIKKLKIYNLKDLNKAYNLNYIL